MQTERITLDGGAWWEIRSVLTIGMARAAERVCKEYIKPSNLADVAQGKSKELQFDTDLGGIDLFEVTRELVFSATVAWSYGPVNRQTFENEIPQADYRIVAGRGDELFGSTPLAVRTERS